MGRVGRNKSVGDLIGIQKLTEHGIVSADGTETVFFLIKPSNLSVMPEEVLRSRVYALMTVLKGVNEIGMMCLNSRENFEENKRFLRERIKEEMNPKIRDLLHKDLKDLDNLQVRMATSREFVLTVRPQEKTERDKELLYSKIQKMLDDQRFQARIANRDDLKRILAVFFSQNVTTDYFDDYDGESFLR